MSTQLKTSLDLTACATAFTAWKGWFDILVPHSWSEAAAELSFFYLSARILAYIVNRLTIYMRRKWGS